LIAVDPFPDDDKLNEWLVENREVVERWLESVRPFYLTRK
jgi:hypothetical protein